MSLPPLLVDERRSTFAALLGLGLARAAATVAALRPGPLEAVAAAGSEDFRGEQLGLRQEAERRRPHQDRGDRGAVIGRRRGRPGRDEAANAEPRTSEQRVGPVHRCVEQAEARPGTAAPGLVLQHGRGTRPTALAQKPALEMVEVEQGGGIAAPRELEGFENRPIRRGRESGHRDTEAREPALLADLEAQPDEPAPGLGREIDGQDLARAEAVVTVGRRVGPAEKEIAQPGEPGPAVLATPAIVAAIPAIVVVVPIVTSVVVAILVAVVVPAPIVVVPVVVLSPTRGAARAAARSPAGIVIVALAVVVGQHHRGAARQRADPRRAGEGEGEQRDGDQTEGGGRSVAGDPRRMVAIDR